MFLLLNELELEKPEKYIPSSIHIGDTSAFIVFLLDEMQSSVYLSRKRLIVSYLNTKLKPIYNRKKKKTSSFHVIWNTSRTQYHFSRLAMNYIFKCIILCSVCAGVRRGCPDFEHISDRENIQLG